MSIGLQEITLIVIAIIILFGAKRIPEIARSLGRASYEFKKAKESIQQEAQELTDAVNSIPENTQKDDTNKVGM